MQFIDLQAQYLVLKKEIDENIHHVLDSSQYMMGDFVNCLEKELAEYCGVKYCISCANGTDALQLALMTWGISRGDAVFVPSFTFYSTAEVVSLLGATPIFIDVDEKTFNIDTVELEKTILKLKKEKKLNPKVIIPVDLFGQPADYDEITRIAQENNLLILEDAAQGFGSSIRGKKACSFGDIATTSFFPAKPLGCYGDGGALFTDNDSYYEKLISLRIHGKGNFKYDNVRVGMNSRLDTIQAGILLPKLHAFKNHELEKRNNIAEKYAVYLQDIVEVPFVKQEYVSSWAQYTILLKNEHVRDQLKGYLEKKGIPTMIYYPKPLHLQDVYKGYNYNLGKLSNSERIAKNCLSLPMHPYMQEDDQMTIINGIIEFMNDKTVY